MEELVVGEGALELLEIDKVLRRSSSFAELLRNWKSFARNLSVNEASLPGLERQINLQILPLDDAPLEILKLWKAQKASAATLRKVWDALRECGLLDIAELLGTTFCQTKPGKFSGNQLMKIIKKEVLPEDPPKFYIARNFSYKNQLNKKVFMAYSTEDHVFLVEGIARPELARVVDFRPIDFSGNQLEEVTMQYIVLELDEDYDKICSLTTKPVHFIQYKDNSFFWIKSSKKLKVIREYIKDDQGENFDEEEMITRIESTSPPCALSIADSPGMGKTVVLKNLAFNIMSRNPTAVVIFLALQEFMQKLEHIESPLEAIEAIFSYAAVNIESKQILQDMFKHTSKLFYLFLDGYDEILETKLNIADSFLLSLKSLTNAKLILSTRPHLKSRLEGVFSQLSFEILPFTEKDQEEFLTKYWISKHEAKENEILKKFASQCLESLENDMLDKERSIAGIPLQCWMLAEVFAEDAKRASKLKSLRDDMIRLTSFFEMYKSLINLKFSKIPEHERENYINAHVLGSIALLFPEWIKKFEPYLDGHKSIDENVMYSIGLVEKSPNINKPRFLHRTFAEYILADFVVKGLRKYSVCVEFLYKKIFGADGTIKLVQENVYDRHELKNPVIGYFIDVHVQGNQMDDSLMKRNLLKANISNKDFCIAACASCFHNLENAFDLTAKILRHRNMTIREDLRDTYFKYLPIQAVSMAKNESLCKKVLKFTSEKFGVNINFHVWMDEVGNIECTPLHFALYWGNYNVVSFLLKEYANEILGMSGLLHYCVSYSATDSDSELAQKLTIIDLLLLLNPGWLTECIDGWFPILSVNIHLKLLQHLLEKE